VHDGTDVHELAVREVSGDEKNEWWTRATAAWPAYDEYQANTERPIPVFVLSPA
jgi:deazaflavin-dependent oxidoreductase (nitroreductase family)